MYIFICVCVRERDRERERECVWQRKRNKKCLRQEERERVKKTEGNKQKNWEQNTKNRCTKSILSKTTHLKIPNTLNNADITVNLHEKTDNRSMSLKQYQISRQILHIKLFNSNLDKHSFV